MRGYVIDQCATDVDTAAVLQALKMLLASLQHPTEQIIRSAAWLALTFIAPFFNESPEMCERRVVSVTHVRSVIAKRGVPSDLTALCGARIGAARRDRYSKF